MSWEVIKPGLRDWVAAMAELYSERTAKPCVAWRDDPLAFDPPQRAVLHAFGDATKGTDGIRYELDAETQKLIPSTHGNRLFTVSIEFRSKTQEAGKSARFYAERMRNRIAWPRGQAMLKALNVSFVRIETFSDLSTAVDGRVEGRCVLDVRLQTRIQETDAAGGVGYFERAALETTYERPDGQTELVVGPESYGIEE